MILDIVFEHVRFKSIAENEDANIGNSFDVHGSSTIS